MELNELNSIFKKIKNLKILVVGDICTDVYWTCDMSKSVLSRETPFFPLPVVNEKISLGAGGNVINNLHSLGAKKFSVISVLGKDWRAELIKNELSKIGISQNLIECEIDRLTNCYIKPMRKGYIETVEGERIDFESSFTIRDDTEEKIISNIIAEGNKADVIIVADQFIYGTITDKIRLVLSDLGKNGKPVIVDSRMNIDKYQNCILKPNEIECSRALNIKEAHADIDTYKKWAIELSKKQNSNICLTLGEKGAVTVQNSEINYINAINLDPPFDTVGAGDTFLAAFSLVYGVTKSMKTAAEVGCMASAVTVKKIGMTGTASKEEILKLFDK